MADDPNLYGYCGQNPVNFIDPTGHFKLNVKMDWASGFMGVLSSMPGVGDIISGVNIFGLFVGKQKKNDQYEIVLTDIPTEEAVKKAVAITSSFEGSGYSNLAGDFDDQGLSFGLLQWNFGQGTLQPLLMEMAEKNPEKFREAFGDKTDKMLEVLKGSKEQQMEWAKSINTSKKTIEKSWSDSFKKLGEIEEFQQIQRDHIKPYIDQAVKISKKYGLYSEQGFALAFDIAVQNWTVRSSADKKISTQIKLREAVFGEISEKQRMIIIANAVADVSKSQFIEDVRSRKLTIAKGTGIVHRKYYNLSKEYNLRDNVFWMQYRYQFKLNIFDQMKEGRN